MLAHIDKRIAISDTLIASVALTANIKLFTLNRKDFNYIEGKKLYNPKRKNR
jgi:predicted nucleic acid-binding protein